MTNYAAFAVIAAVILTPAPVAAAAQGKAWQVGDDSMHLYNADLDLNSAAGRAALLTRVETAAARLCRDRAEPADCARRAVAAAIQGRTGAALQLARVERGERQVAAR